MVSRDFFPDLGGIASHVMELGSALVQQRHNVDVVRISYENQKDHVKKISGMNVHYIFSPTKLRGLRYFISAIKAARYLEKLVEEKKIDVVHWHDYLASSIETKIISKKIPAVFTNHTSNYLEDEKSIKLAFVKLMLSHAGAVIAPSRELTEKSFKLRKKNVFYIPNGVDAKKFRPAKYNKSVLKKHSIPLGGKIVLCPRRLEPKNGVIFFVKAAPKIKEKAPDARFLVVGGGYPEERKKILDEIRKRNAEDFVILTGPIENSLMKDYYNASDVVVLPSLMEATSIAGLEAMACAKPLVGTNVGGIPEIIENNVTGYLVAPENPQEIALKTVLLLLNEKKRTKFGNHARKKVLENFSWKIIAQKTVEVYKKVLE